MTRPGEYAALDPALALMLTDLQRSPAPALHQASPDRARRGYAKLAAALAHPSDMEPDDVSVADDILPGDPAIALRIYRPRPMARLTPIVVYLHGGGWVVGDLDTHRGIARRTSVAAQVTVVAVHYRRAPEHPFPAALHDVVRVLRWAYSLEVPVGVLGDSAGANLALAASAEVAHGVSELLLAYPLLHHVSRTRSRRRFAEGRLLATATIEWFSSMYAGDRSVTDLDGDPRANPLNADLRGLPPCRVLLAGHDPLLDEGHELAAALGRAGVDLDVVVEPTMLHGFLELGAISPAARAITTRELIAFGDRLRSRPSPRQSRARDHTEQGETRGRHVKDR